MGEKGKNGGVGANGEDGRAWGKRGELTWENEGKFWGRMGGMLELVGSLGMRKPLCGA
ncbi:hypothetical protein [Bartonella sp. B1099]|uniref:hypothetical protein n=1 Tax=Bartonella sp. B1099 TaxID=2911422 RepID=UPI0020C2BEEB|nr:hypothetical protein [Bartonella sp. B1099]